MAILNRLMECCVNYLKQGMQILAKRSRVKIESAREGLNAYESSTEHETNINESRQLVALLTEKTNLQSTALNSYTH